MRQCFTNIKLHWLLFVRVSITLLVMVSILTLMVFILSDTTNAFQSSPSSRMFIMQFPQITPPPTAISSPTVQNSQEQQIISEAQNDVTIANTIITFTGVFVGIVTAIVAIAGFFGISELFKIRELRTKLASEIEEMNDKAKQTKDQIEELNRNFESEIQRFENRLGDLTQKSTEFDSKSQRFEERLRQLTLDFESKRFLEASYYYNEGTNAYIIGDNAHAIEYYKQALQLQPDNTRIMERLGRAYSNLNDMVNAIKYLDDALEIDPENVPALRSLALCYRYTDKPRAIEYLKLCLLKNPSDYEGWDFLGLLYRDQKLIDEAINAHEQALILKQRPETEFYLSILLLLLPKGDKSRAKSLMLSAYKGTLTKEHDQRIRPVWKILIHASVPILDGKKEETLELIQTLASYITTQRIYEALKSHLQFLLEATDHKEWMPEFMDIVKLKEM